MKHWEQIAHEAAKLELQLKAEQRWGQGVALFLDKVRAQLTDETWRRRADELLADRPKKE